MRIVVWTVLVAALALACAVEQPPPGGPEDKTPPGLVATVPVADSAGVDPGSEIGFTFSEDMLRGGVERLVFFSPDIEIGDVRWKDRTIYIRPLQPLHPDTTYLVTIKAGFRDYHKVAAMEGHEFAFATSAAIDSGTISGRVYFRREPTAKGVVQCFILPVDSSFVAGAIRPDREAKVDDKGDYTIRYLPNRDSRFIVWAFEDANKNLTFAPENEASMLLPDTVMLTPDAPFAAGKDIWIVDPTEPATLAGVVVNASGLDTFLVRVALYADSLGARPTYLQACDSTGAYEFASVMGGKYLLRAFVDVVADSACGRYPCFDDSTVSCEEPCVQYADTLNVEPGSAVVPDSLTLNPAAGRKE
jgi:hypothetical protein